MTNAPPTIMINNHHGVATCLLGNKVPPCRRETSPPIKLLLYERRCRLSNETMLHEKAREKTLAAVADVCLSDLVLLPESVDRSVRLELFKRRVDRLKQFGIPGLDRDTLALLGERLADDLEPVLIDRKSVV